MFRAVSLVQLSGALVGIRMCERCESLQKIKKLIDYNHEKDISSYCGSCSRLFIWRLEYHRRPRARRIHLEVNIKSNLIAMATRLAAKADPQVAQLLQGLQAVRVNVIGLDEANREDVHKRMDAIRKNLDSKGWERIVTAQNQKDDVGVYLKTRGDEAIAGLVVLVVEAGKEAVLLNIVGDIKPDKIAEVGERLHIEPLKKVAAAIGK
jgi:hypothetical protein